MPSSSASAQKATVEDAESSSPSPPPSTVNLPEGTSAAENDKVVDQPIDSLGDDEEEDDGSESKKETRQDENEEEEEEEEWDPSAEMLPGQTSIKEKGKNKESSETNHQGAGAEGGEEQPWQAVWSAEQNAWYFWNTKTSEVSWTNPLEPSTSGSSSEQPPLPNSQPPLPSTSYQSTGSNAWESNVGDGAPEIDPGLAHLFGDDGVRGGGGDPSMQRATFNARTGRFTPLNYEYTVGHLDEYNRSKRMNNHYFDVDQWEKQKAEENLKRKRMEEEGRVVEKKTTKKDMERFKKKNAERKARSQAWLRE